MRRAVVLAVIVAAGAAGVAIGIVRDSAALNPRLTWVAAARQYGPVAYRDPAGAISPDGRWIAYSEGRFLRVRPIGGGPSTDFTGADQIRSIAWALDSRTILANGYLGPGTWALYDRVDRTARPFPATIRQPAWTADGSIAAVGVGPNGNELWTLNRDGSILRRQPVAGAISDPAPTPRGEVGCIARTARGPRVTIPCGGRPVTTRPDIDAYGPIAFSGDWMYFGSPSAAGTLDLWEAPLDGGHARRLTGFSRDTYAPSASSSGALLFKVQSYRTSIAAAPAAGGTTVPLTAFQSETPSWHPDGRSLGLTFGSWRRVTDDARYPDIAQDVGIVRFDPARLADAPSAVVQASPSEDQSLCWSPNGKWIAFHSHKDQSDDIWLRAVTGSAAARRVSYLGRGAETGWPRWSSDGHWLLFDGASPTTHRQALHVAGVDQESGTVTIAPREVSIGGVDGEPIHAEWLADTGNIAVIAKQGPGRHVIFVVSKDGGAANIVHRFATEHDASGLAASPDGRDVAFIAPAADGFFQVFRMPVTGGPPTQVTSDASDKTQPAWSPDGRWIAFTVWSYGAQFWTIDTARR